MVKKLYSTQDVAKMLGVHYTSVINWVEEGMLRAYSTPGGHRRMDAEAIIAFCREHNMHFPEDLEVDEKIKILIVDDDKRVLPILIEALTQANNRFEIYTATDGFDAGIAVGDFKPDLVVLDVFLPEANGVTVCRRLKKENPNIKILVATGHGSPEVRDEVFKAGADAFLEKPFDIPVFVEHVESLLSKTLAT